MRWSERNAQRCSSPERWQNIKAVKIENYSIFALQEDGTLLMTGYGDEVL